MKGISMREVERETKISTAYLSQLENGAIVKPSPQKLHKLAQFYGVSYEALMKAAGHIAPDPNATSIISFDDLGLSDEERDQVVDFIKYLRSRRKKTDET